MATDNLDDIRKQLLDLGHNAAHVELALERPHLRGKPITEYQNFLKNKKVLELYEKNQSGGGPPMSSVGTVMVKKSGELSNRSKAALSGGFDPDNLGSSPPNQQLMMGSSPPTSPSLPMSKEKSQYATFSLVSPQAAGNIAPLPTQPPKGNDATRPTGAKPAPPSSPKPPGARAMSPPPQRAISPPPERTVSPTSTRPSGTYSPVTVAPTKATPNLKRSTEDEDTNFDGPPKVDTTPTLARQYSKLPINPPEATPPASNGYAVFTPTAEKPNNQQIPQQVAQPTPQPQTPTQQPQQQQQPSSAASPHQYGSLSLVLNSNKAAQQAPPQQPPAPVRVPLAMATMNPLMMAPAPAPLVVQPTVLATQQQQQQQQTQQQAPPPAAQQGQRKGTIGKDKRGAPVFAKRIHYGPPVEKQFTLFKTYAVICDQNSKYRQYMEDTHFVMDQFSGNTNMAYFGVYDGHGGKDVAEYCADALPLNIMFQIRDKPNMLILDAIKRGYTRTDDALGKKGLGQDCGSTAVTAVFALENGKKFVYTANIGDTSAVLIRDGTAILLTEEHKAKSAKEKERILSTGGVIEGGRIIGEGADLAVTRAFGDFCLKKWVIPDPYVSKMEILPSDSFVVIATDGLWDALSGKEVASIIMANLQETPLKLAEMLLTEAFLKSSTDNTSVILVAL